MIKHVPNPHWRNWLMIWFKAGWSTPFVSLTLRPDLELLQRDRLTPGTLIIIYVNMIYVWTSDWSLQFEAFSCSGNNCFDFSKGMSLAYSNILLKAIGLFPTAIMADQLPSNAEEYAFAYQCMLHQEMVKLAGVPESHVLASECLACV